MAGRVVVSTLNNDTGVLATQNGMTGIAKAWVNFAGASGTINGSFNVSSITVNGTGDYTVNFTTAMPNANYSWATTAYRQPNSANNANAATAAPTTTTFRFLTTDATFSPVNATLATATIFSS